MIYHYTNDLEYKTNKYNLMTDKKEINKKLKKVIITGGAGFIGSHFVNHVLRNKNYLVFNIDKLNYASSLKRINSNLSKNNYKFFNLDLKNKKDTFEIVDSINPDYIVHFAAESHVDNSIKNPQLFIESNYIGTFNLLEAIRIKWENWAIEKKKEFRFIHVSTDEVFGSLGQYGSFSEKTPYDPRSPYSASKASSDHLVNAWNHTYGLPTIVTNCSNNYGPWQFPEKLIPLTIFKSLRKEKIPVYGDGSNIRDWLYVEDHIEALMLVLEKGKIGEKYCIGGECEKTNLSVVKEICKIMNKLLPYKNPYEDFIDFVIDRKGHDKRYSINNTKIKEDLGFEPKYTFHEGIELTVKWYLENIKWCDQVINK